MPRIKLFEITSVKRSLLIDKYLIYKNTELQKQSHS